MNKIRFIYLTLLILFVGYSGYSQTMTVTGVVKDPTGLPLPGASVAVIGTTKGASTDFDGQFAIDGVSASDVLLISYVGFEEQQITVGSQTTFNITLQES